MAIVKSDQITDLESSPKKELKANVDDSRVRMKFFSITPGAVALGSTLRLVTLPKGARILSGKIDWPAGTGVALSTISVGTSALVAKYLAATAADVAFNGELAKTQVLNYGEELAAETEIVATTAGAALNAAQTIKGHIQYARD